MNSERPFEDSRSDEEFRDLLGSTGGRESLDAARVAEIKETIRPAWKEAVRSAAETTGTSGVTDTSVIAAGSEGTRDVRAWLAAATLLALALVGWWWIARSGGAAAASFTVAGGSEAFVVESGERRDLMSGRLVEPGAVLVTGRNAGAFVSLVDGDGRSIRLGSAGRLALVSARRLELLEGRVYVDHESRPGEGAEQGVSVETALGTVREIGTQFEVQLETVERGQVLHAVVRTGRVEFESGAHREQVEAGEELVLEGGTITRRRVEPTADRWAWVLASAPPFDLTDASAHDVLHWVARETGRRLVYESDHLEREMTHTAIESGRQRVTLDEALSMLPAVGLEVSLRGNVLRVRDATNE